nr:cupredoxin domain-containing protein [Candidatus Woesearchaeota archaeon]
MKIELGIGKLLGIFGVILIAIFLIFAVKNSFSKGDNVNGSIVNDNIVNGEGQVVDLTVKDYNYYPNTINLAYNVPAKIVVDTDKVKGCFQNIAIPEFNIRKLVRQGDNVISFIPNKKGTFSFSCSMGMGFGKIVVS